MLLVKYAEIAGEIALDILRLESASVKAIREIISNGTYYNSSNKGEKVLQNLHYKNNNEKDNGKRLNLEDENRKF
jgi:hypothetical protein